MERLPMPPQFAYRGRIDAVHHTDRSCPVGRRIPAELLTEGTGGLPLCSTCRVRGEARPPSGPFPTPEHTGKSEASGAEDPDDAGPRAPVSARGSL
jgi:hypothetical protein